MNYGSAQSDPHSAFGDNHNTRAAAYKYSFIIEYSLIPEVLLHKLQMTKNGW